MLDYMVVSTDDAVVTFRKYPFEEKLLHLLSIPFYLHDAMLARVIATATCLSVCLSVRLSVTRRYCA